MGILDFKKVTGVGRTKLKWLVTYRYLFNGFTEKLKQSYNLCNYVNTSAQARQANAALWCAATLTNFLHKLTK